MPTSDRHKRLPLGSVSTGTANANDLFPRFVEASRKVILSHADRSRVRQMMELWIAGRTADGKSNLILELMHILERYAPPMCYFGPHPSDPANFGVWISEQLMDDAVLNRKLVKVPDLSQASYQKQKRYFDYALVTVPDGTRILYNSYRAGRDSWRWREIWAIPSEVPDEIS